MPAEERKWATRQGHIPLPTQTASLEPRRRTARSLRAGARQANEQGLCFDKLSTDGVGARIRHGSTEPPFTVPPLRRLSLANPGSLC